MKLGMLVKDKLSDFYGTVYCVADHLSGARRVQVASPVTRNGKTVFDWFDEKQLEPLDRKEKQGSLFSEKDDDGPKLPKVEEKDLPPSELSRGDKVKEPISGFEGTVITINRYLYDCARIVVRTDWFDEDGLPVDGIFDEPELELVEEAEEEDEVEPEESRPHTGGAREDGSGDPRYNSPMLYNMGLKI